MSLAIRFSVMRRFVFGGIGLCALAVSGSALTGAALVGSAQAALITQTLNFEATGFVQNGVGPASPPYSTVSGTVVLTYDDATTTNITGQAVDSVSFTDPTGVFETTDVLFDLRIQPNVNFPQHAWEIDIYGSDQGSGVSLFNSADWLLYVIGLNPLGADFNADSAVATQFVHSDGNFSNGNFGFFTSDTVFSITGSSVPAGGGTPVPAPAALALLGLGLAGAGLMAARRQSRSDARTARGLAPLPA